MRVCSLFIPVLTLYLVSCLLPSEADAQKTIASRWQLGAFNVVDSVNQEAARRVARAANAGLNDAAESLVLTDEQREVRQKFITTAKEMEVDGDRLEGLFERLAEYRVRIDDASFLLDVNTSKTRFESYQRFFMALEKSLNETDRRLLRSFAFFDSIVLQHDANLQTLSDISFASNERPGVTIQVNLTGVFEPSGGEIWRNLVAEISSRFPEKELSNRNAEQSWFTKFEDEDPRITAKVAVDISKLKAFNIMFDYNSLLSANDGTANDREQWRRFYRLAHELVRYIELSDQKLISHLRKSQRKLIIRNVVKQTLRRYSVALDTGSYVWEITGNSKISQPYVSETYTQNRMNYDNLWRVIKALGNEESPEKTLPVFIAA